MNAGPRFAYVQARIQSRYAELPDMAARENLGTVQDFGHYLQQANAAGFSRWLERLGVNSTPHVIENSLRAVFRQHVKEVAKWMPDAWNDATLWFAILIDLEQVRQIIAGEPLPDWTRDDPFQCQIMASNENWPLSLIRDAEDEQKWAENWRMRWCQFWPDMGKDEQHSLELLAQALPIACVEEARIDWLKRQFRQHACGPVAIFSYLTLILADVLRLRGEMMRRVQFVGG